MTIVSVSDYIKETGNYQRAGGSYKRTLRVDFTAGYSAAALIHNTDSRLYKYGDIHPEDTASYCSAVDVQMIDEGDDQQSGSALYICSFSPLVTGYELNPLDRPAEIDWGGESQTEVMYVDEDGVAVLNSAKDRYDPMPEREILGPAVTITRFEASNPASIIETNSMTTNSGAIWGQSTDILKLGIITSQKVWENGVAYWRTKYPIYKNRKGWKLKLYDNGHRKRNDDGSKRRIHDDMGQTSPVPVLLNGLGKELADGASPVVYPTNGFRRYTSANWASISPALPNPWA